MFDMKILRTALLSLIKFTLILFCSVKTIPQEYLEVLRHAHVGKF